MKNELRDAGREDEITLNNGLREIFQVAGDSMFPALKEGDWVLVNPNAAFEIGDIVVARHPFKKSVKIIKRIAEILSDEKYILLSDNPEDGTDSRSFGAISAKDILGKAEAKINKSATNDTNDTN